MGCARPRLLLACLMLLCGGAWAAPPTAIDRVLGGVEHAASADEVRALGPDADQLLMAVAGDGEAEPLRRWRAILALQHVPSAAARAFLLALVQRRAEATGSEVLELAAALAALAPYGPEAAGAVLPFIAHRSADVRQSAAATLALTGAPAAAGALQLRLAVERDPGVRRTLARALHALTPR
jgi:hypothetical protein